MEQVGKLGEPQKMNLNDFKTIEYAKTRGGASSNWVVSEDGYSVTQKNNSNATIFYGETVFDNYKIEGHWENNGGDDDFMGFVFAMNDRNQYYLFQWKRGQSGIRKLYRFRRYAS